MENTSDSASWSARRKEILNLFETLLFGKTPELLFDRIECVKTEEKTLPDGIVWETYGLSLFKGERWCGMHFDVTYNGAGGKGNPVILNINPFSRNQEILDNPRYSFSSGGIFPALMIVRHGFVAVQCNVDELSADSVIKDSHDIMSIFPPEGPDGWSTIDAWAWAARTVALQLKECGFTSERITVSGFSRGARTALWAAAKYDDVFSSVYSCQSGCCGAAMHRGKTGETIADITSRYPQWSCDNFKQFAGKEKELPFDQHMLLALIAPRPLYISSAREDRWSCPEKEFESCVLVSRFYDSLGSHGLDSFEYPSDDAPISGGAMQYHVKNGGHDCTEEDWEKVLSFLIRQSRS